MSAATNGTDAPSLTDIDVAVAHWHIDSWGGAEYLVTKLADAVGESCVYTVGPPEPSEPNPYGEVTFYDITQDLSGLIGPQVRHLMGRPAEYGLWADIDWRQYGNPDVLITSGATARAVITPDNTLNINYCHSPPRWFYDLYHDRKRTTTGRLARPLVRWLRTADNALDDRVDHYFANSPIVARRLWKYYKRDSEVLYPPINMDAYTDRGDEGFYLHLGRLDIEKGIEPIVAAFEGTDHKIVFAGGKGDANITSRIRTAPNMTYEGFVTEENKYELLGTCRAVVFNGRNEDFGIVPIEANASGKPCLARDEGFPGMFIEDGENGILHDGSPTSIRAVIERFERDGIASDPADSVDEFSMTAFEQRLQTRIPDLYWNFDRRFSQD
jgi:glycosyltransferase involved in cell wall biosynthesis